MANPALPPAAPHYDPAVLADLVAKGIAKDHTDLAKSCATLAIDGEHLRSQLSEAQGWMRCNKTRLMGPVGAGFIAILLGQAVASGYVFYGEGGAVAVGALAAIGTGIAACMIKEHPEWRAASLGGFLGSLGALSALEGVLHQPSLFGQPNPQGQQKQ